MSRPRAHPTMLVDDAQVRVTRWHFEPGAETGWHRHEMDYVVVALTDLTMTLEEPGNSVRTAVVPAGEAYRRDVGIEHNVINGGDRPMVFIETELKQPHDR